MNGPKDVHPDETPITNQIIADADANPETRIVFLIKRLANQCKEFERRINFDPALRSGTFAEGYEAMRDDAAVSSVPKKVLRDLINQMNGRAWCVHTTSHLVICLMSKGYDLNKDGTEIGALPTRERK